ncbi:MAG: class I tRNA ligase family protein, partial [Acidobacteriota bacterium]
MLEARPDWCISRQRAWGLPIPAFFNPEGQPLLTEETVRAVARAVRRNGSNFWFEASPGQLLADYDASADAEAPTWVKAAGFDLDSLTKGNDIFDVWFESGSSWNGVLRERKIGFPADLYLEGSDQHRGWFQLSLLPGLGVTGQSPFKTVLTHGFMVDAEGRKMSKSGGNAVKVEDVLKIHGADICRWWVSTLNYTNDIKVDLEFFKVASDEYRKVRNTIRFLLGNLNNFDPEKDRVELGPEDRFSVDAWALQRLGHFIKQVDNGYASFNFKRVAEVIFDFCNDSMSAVYLAAVKDRLYCDALDSRRRRRTQTVLYEIAHSLIRAVAPILVHTAEEAWLALTGELMESERSVHLCRLPEGDAFEADSGWERVMSFRQSVLKVLEDAKQKENPIKNPLDAGITAVVKPATLEKLAPYREELADLCGVSRLDLVSGETVSFEVQDLRDEPKCERSWKRDGTVQTRSDGGLLSDRDAAVVGV